MARACWVDSGNDFNRALALPPMSITQPHFDVRDARITLDYLKARKAEGLEPGLYLCSQGDGWPSHSKLTPEAWADWAYETVQKRIAPGTSGRFPLVDLNCETGADWVMRMLRQWRKHAPNRSTAYVCAAHQWPLFTAYGTELRRLKIVIRPECFVDPGMRRVESADEALGWMRVGLDPLMVKPMLDGAALGEWWGETSGASVFTQGRIP
jgi:hypothetical protein